MYIWLPVPFSTVVTGAFPLLSRKKRFLERMAKHTLKHNNKCPCGAELWRIIIHKGLLRIECARHDCQNALEFQAKMLVGLNEYTKLDN